MISTGPSTRYFSGRNWLGRVTTASFCAIMMALAVVAAGCGGSSHHHNSQPHHFSFSVSGGIWVANGSDVLEFTSPFTSRTPNIAPSVIVTNSDGFNSTQGVLFDTAGDLWVIDGGNLAGLPLGETPVSPDPALEEFTAAQLAAGGSLNLIPAVTITNTTDTGEGTLGFPQQAVFDSTGNMWVTDNSSGSVDVFSADQLTATQDVSPFAQLTSVNSPDVLTGPLGIAFDSSNNLWVANNGGTTIFEYDNATVEDVLTGGTHGETPTVVLSDDGANSIQGPWALVFSTLGDLWSSNANTPFTVVAFGPDQLITGNPTPAVTFNPVNVKGVPSLSAPNGLAFDNFGNLAAANSAAPFSIAIFAADQLGDSGNTKPEVLISGSATLLAAPAGAVFGPQIP